MTKLKQLLFHPVDHVLLQVPCTLVASVLSALLDCGYMVLLVEIFGWDPVSAAVVSYLVGGVLQYVLCSIWVFPAAPKSKAVGFIAFTVLSLGGLGITWGVMALGAAVFVPYGISKVFALGLAFVWNFTSRKLLLFEKKADSQKSNLPDEGREPESYPEWVATMAPVTTTR